MSRRFANHAHSGAEGDSIMDYVVVFVTMLMIAGYACLVGRVLHDTK
jgi:hypothetical protein